MSPPDNPRLRPVAMLAHTYYDEDPRVRREAEALVARGRGVDVFALRRPGDEPTEVVDGVRVHRLDIQRHQGAGLVTYLAEYLAFFVRAGLAAIRAHRRRRYALVQVHTLPDFLVFAALPLRLAGVPVLLDLHEAMPEFFAIRFSRSSSPVVRRLLLLQERLSITGATAAITVNDALRDRLIGLGVPPAKIGVVLNSPSLARFDPARHEARPFMADGCLRLVYTGALSPIYELDVALRAMAELRERRPDLIVTLDLYGRDFAEVPLADLVAELGLEDRVTFRGRVAIDAVPAAVAAADIGLAPTRRNAFTDFSLSTKIFEYAAMGKPVVASRLPMVERTFAQGTVWTYPAGDPASLAGSILAIVDDPTARAAAVEATLVAVRERSWERESERYAALVEDLAPDGRSSPPATSDLEES